MKNNTYTLIFALLMGVSCALLLTAAAEFTSPYRAANAKAEEIRNVLNVLNVSVPDDASPDELVEIFSKNVVQKTRAGLPFYSYISEDTSNAPEAYAVQFEGQGLWGPIKGFLALESDMKTIRGITVYEQEETPGLGGEIASERFQEQFVGKSILNEQQEPGIRITRGGGELGPNAVEGITGATMTCEKVESILNEAITKIVGDL